jgi:hypothetical protein
MIVSDFVSGVTRPGMRRGKTNPLSSVTRPEPPKSSCLRKETPRLRDGGHCPGSRQMPTILPLMSNLVCPPGRAWVGGLGRSLDGTCARPSQE